MHDLATHVFRALSAVLLLGVALGCASRGPTDPSSALRVMSYNVRHGLGMDDVIDLERVARVIERVRPDVVALQEIDVGCARSGAIDEARRLGELCGMHAAFGRFMDYDGGEYGMAMLSRHEILAVENIALPPGDEPRTSLAIRIRPDDAGPELVIVGVHFYRTDEERLAQARTLAAHLANETAPVILAGDFNSPPDGPVLVALEESWTNAPKGEDRLTWPSDAPEVEIDHLLYRPAHCLRVLRVDVLDEAIVSDHRPLYADFALR